MSGTSSPNSGLTRRSFLKATGAAAGALGLAGAANMIATDTWLAPGGGAGGSSLPPIPLPYRVQFEVHDP